MPNSWFQFRQFRINQDRCAMKVGTDGVLLGAWTPVPENTRKIADLGTGTGLLALMLAQRSEAGIHAVEVDKQAAEQAAENFAASPWSTRLTVICCDILSFAEQNKEPFDLVVCNPPYFPGHLLPSDPGRSKARHITTRSIGDWLLTISHLMLPTGKAALILPFNETDNWLEEAALHGLYPEQRIHVRPLLEKSFKRVLLYLSKQPGTIRTNELTIETGKRGIYTREFYALVKDFYIAAGSI